MKTVMKNFSLFKKVEVALVPGGLLLIFILPQKQFWLGSGIGMLLQGSLMLTADIFAERRGAIYVERISEQKLGIVN